MDYEKKYKEMKARVLEMGRGYVKGLDYSKPRQIAEYIDPELKESGDERIKEAIITTIHLYYGEPLEDEAKEMIAWLEKQKPIQNINKEDEEVRQYIVRIMEQKDINVPMVQKALAWLENIPYTIDHEKREGFHLGYKAALEKQGESYTKRDVDDAFVEGMAFAKDELEKQGEQKETLCDKCKKAQPSHSCQDITALGRCYIENINTSNKVEPKFKVKYAGSEYNVLKIKEIAGVTYYGIEDEPNHIDYVQAENCEIISVYSIKENGSPYPTKPAAFSEQKSWSEEDEKMYRGVMAVCDVWSTATSFYPKENEDVERLKNWLKSLRPQNTWKPSDEQITVLELASKYERVFTPKQIDILIDLKEQLKKLRGE